MNAVLVIKILIELDPIQIQLSKIGVLPKILIKLLGKSLLQNLSFDFFAL